MKESVKLFFLLLLNVCFVFHNPIFFQRDCLFRTKTPEWFFSSGRRIESSHTGGRWLDTVELGEGATPETCHLKKILYIPERVLFCDIFNARNI